VEYTRVRHSNEVQGIGGTVHNAQAFHVHELFRDNPKDYDIAVVNVWPAFQFGIIPLAKQHPAAGVLARASGWGLLPGTATKPVIRRSVLVHVFDREACRKLIGKGHPIGEITDRMLCAGHLADHKLDCGGDIGGPLVANNELVGIISTSVCGSGPTTIGVFSDVASLYEWIDWHASLERVESDSN
jgi:trypsin